MMEERSIVQIMPDIQKILSRHSIKLNYVISRPPRQKFKNLLNASMRITQCVCCSHECNRTGA